MWNVICGCLFQILDLRFVSRLPAVYVFPARILPIVSVWLVPPARYPASFSGQVTIKCQKHTFSVKLACHGQKLFLCVLNVNELCVWSLARSGLVMEDRVFRLTSLLVFDCRYTRSNSFFFSSYVRYLIE